MRHNCLKCGSSMEEGFLFDRSHHDYGNAGSWVQGAPERSFWTGTKVRGRARYCMKSYRCTRCGYLESYAVEETKK